LILPGLSWILGLECLTLALDSGGSIHIPNQWKIALYLLEATVAPGIFLSTFVVTFLAYRTRSIPFCFTERGPGRSTSTEHDEDNDQEVMQALVRPATMIVMVRLFSLALFLLTLVVNFDVVWATNDLAGRTGWKSVIQEPWSGSTAHIFIGLLPMALVSVSCVYFSVLLWRYGSFFSMVIYPSVFNPWISPICGTACMMVGQMFGPDLFPLLSNAGIMLYLMCIVRVLYEVRHDMKQAGDLGSFLDALGDDAVTGSVTPNMNSKWGTTANDDTSSSKVDDDSQQALPPFQ
jgi:hypothetical protein